jgi:arylsulfatase A
MSHIHGPIVPTPDSKPDADADQLYSDNVEDMDKLVGKFMDELDKQHLRENTLVIFIGDNGTARFGTETATVDGKHISGAKATMLEGGSRVPFVATWPAAMPKGKVNKDLTDFSDFFATFADLAGAPLPDGVKIDGHSFAPQLRGDKGTPREWVYVELNGKTYVRDAKYKLTKGGEMFDLSEAPFKEIPVERGSENAEAKAARKSLQAVLDEYKAAPFDPKTKSPPVKKRAKARRNQAA